MDSLMPIDNSCMWNKGPTYGLQEIRIPDYQPFTLFALYTLWALVTRKPCVAFETGVFTMCIILK